MKKFILAIILIICLSPVVLFADNKIIKSQALQDLEIAASSEKINLDTDLNTSLYLQQLGIIEEDINYLDLVNRAISDKKYPVTVGDVYTLTYFANRKLVTVPIQIMFEDLVVPSIGSFSIKDKTFVDLKVEIENQIASQIPYSYPNLTLTGLGTFFVNVTGEVISNDKVGVNSLTYLSDLAYFATENASTRSVIVIDENNNETEYDLYAALKSDGVNPRLSYGDTVVFTKAENKVTISGAVVAEGAYQLDDLNLDVLIDDYAKGLLSTADLNSIKITRYVDGKVETITSEYGSGFDLQNNDIIVVDQINHLAGTIVLEGSLLSGSSILGDQKYYYQFAYGDTLYDLVQDLSLYFLPTTDLVNTCLTRDNSSSIVSFQEVLSGSLDKELLDGDVYTLPFSRAVVNVFGAVNRSGLYSIVPGKTADYYIAQASGYSDSASGVGKYKLLDKDGNELSKDSIITAECSIEVARDTIGPSLVRTTAILGITSSVLTIITAVLNLPGLI